ETKKGFLQKMFPKNGAKVPEIRFPGFTEDWEQRKLGELTKIKTGSSDLQDADAKGIYPFFVRSEIIERSNRYIFDGEAILIPGEGRLGEIYHYINGKFDFHQRVYKISDFQYSDTDGKYILYYMQKYFKKHAMKYTVKATVDSLRLPMLTEFDIKIPSLDEQRAISSFFSNLDQAITLHQRKLDLLKETKKGFLQKMFV
ncbi:restriction endonuclease subunit S, partial [Enterococcus faecalis]